MKPSAMSPSFIKVMMRGALRIKSLVLLVKLYSKELFQDWDFYCFLRSIQERDNNEQFGKFCTSYRYQLFISDSFKIFNVFLQNLFN